VTPSADRFGSNLDGSGAERFPDAPAFLPDLSHRPLALHNGAAALGDTR
jgi:hypothetical protein